MGKTSTETPRTSRIALLRKGLKEMDLLPPPLEFWNDITSWSSTHQDQEFVVASKEKQEEDGRENQREEPEL